MAIGYMLKNGVIHTLSGGRRTGIRRDATELEERLTEQVATLEAEKDRLEERIEQLEDVLRDIKAAQQAGELSYRTSTGSGYEAMLAVEANLPAARLREEMRADA